MCKLKSILTDRWRIEKKLSNLDHMSQAEVTQGNEWPAILF